jgi:para-aminobenzoate synthetase/4-amino-4-deoxychorismate lyase
MEMKHIEQREPLLSFEFASLTGEINPITFSKPHKVIIAHYIDEVIPCLKQIQDAIDSGYYAAGFLTYEAAPAFDSSYKVKDGQTMPLLWFGIFSEAQTLSLVTSGTYKLTDWEPSVDLDRYDEAIKSIKQYIENGITYQTNYTIQLHSQFQGDDVALFQKLKRAQSSNYCAYIHTGEHSIISASPELFFHLDGDQITTRPMKGTIERGYSFTEDEAKAAELFHSEKNRAENVMIVDLLRNDLGSIAEAGTVTVPKLFEIERYPTVHQMTSTITANISRETEIVDVFKALFPCGSITGAPKISTMEIIANLENAPREVYCGAIGYITPNKEAIFNVPIRTVYINQKSGTATYGVGGGITWDSTTEGEYHEIIAKANVLKEDRPEFQLLESFLLSDGEFFLLEEHLERLSNSATYFGYYFNSDEMKKVLHDFSKKYSSGEYKVRLIVTKNGEMEIEAQPLNSPKTLTFMLAEEPLNKNNPFLYHKTTNRSVYSYYQKKYPHVFDVLLWNEEGELTEFTNGNVVLEIEGTLWTPPIKSGLLAGMYRDALLKEGIIHEKVLMVDDLNRSSKVFFINSVRKWLDVQLEKDI